MSEGRVIGLVSGKGGVGKTSLSVNLGIALSEFGNEVTIIDTDFSASNLGVHLGRYEHPVKVQDVLKGDSHPEKAIFRHPAGIKAAVSSNEISEVEPDTTNIRRMMEEAKKRSDYVIVDSPPGLNSNVESIMQACDELLIITMPTQTASINAAQIIERAKQFQQPVLGTVVNKVEDDPSKELIEREIEMMTESHIMAKIPHDNIMKESLFENTPLLHYEPFAEASLQIKELAADLDGRQFERPKLAPVKRIVNDLKRKID
ncbi:MAG: AAA family ATPase [Candidatus Nanohaloarchaea archaeon]